MLTEYTYRGSVDGKTDAQMHRAIRVGNVKAAALLPDNHLGYGVPIGAAIAYEGQISPTGVGFDIGCGNTAFRLDMTADDLRKYDLLENTADAIQNQISFGLGRINAYKPEVPVLDDPKVDWRNPLMLGLKDKAYEQFGTVGSGNHYVDLLEDESGRVWVGVHFGSRGLGHTVAKRTFSALNAKDSLDADAVVLDEDSDLGRQYIQAMIVAGAYAYHARHWVCSKVEEMLCASHDMEVNNHHNFAWREEIDGKLHWVVRKGSTPNFPGQLSFVGSSMATPSLILRGKETLASSRLLNSTVHGAGRAMSRGEAKRTIDPEDMRRDLDYSGTILRGGGLDEAPLAYKNMANVLGAIQDTVEVVERLHPLIVVMAGPRERDPYKD